MTEDTITTEMTSTFVGQVYKIWSSECDKCYVGSTKRLLRQRLSKHKEDFRAWQKGKRHYTSSFEIVKYEDAKIELIEEREFGDKQAMLECEKYWIQTLDTVNNRRPIITQDEHKVQKAEYGKNRSKVSCPHCQHMTRNDHLKRHIGRKHAQE